MRELQIGDGPLTAVVLPEAGARLHRLRAFGHDLLRTPPDPAMHLREPFFWGGYVMAPWCNRVKPGTTDLHGRSIRLAANFPDGSAIHGQVHAVPWSAADGRDATMTVRAGADGWPWPYQVSLLATADDASLALRWGLTNLADEPMPAGIGFHPWWRRPIQLRVDAGLAYASNVAPTTEPEPVTGALDLRELGSPADGLDGTWTDAATPAVELAWPDLGLRATMMASAAARYVAVATPPGLEAIAVEPQTHAPDGLARLLDGRSDGLVLLPPGATLALDVEIDVRRA
jgi:aldose 1-epimerase